MFSLLSIVLPAKNTYPKWDKIVMALACFMFLWIKVNADRGLYYLLFGEALLNDGVTFVLFEGFLH